VLKTFYAVLYLKSPEAVLDGHGGDMVELGAGLVCDHGVVVQRPNHAPAVNPGTSLSIILRMQLLHKNQVQQHVCSDFHAHFEHKMLILGWTGQPGVARLNFSSSQPRHW
jgi:hypothetical protein